MRSFVTIGKKALDSIVQERDALKAERDALRAERDALIAEIAALRANADEQWRLDALTATAYVDNA